MSRELTYNEQERIVNRITELRKRLKLSRSAFALRCGYSSVHLMYVEAMKQEPGEDLIKRICQNFGVTEKWLSRKEDDAPSTVNEGVTEGVTGEEVQDCVSRVRQLRLERKISIMNFAKSIQSSPTAILAVEKGERSLTFRYAERIEAVYHVSVDWLLYGDEESKNFHCGQSMIQYLKRHESLRETIWSKMEKEK